MNGIQSFVGGGGAFGKDTRSKKQEQKDRMSNFDKTELVAVATRSSEQQFKDLQQKGQSYKELRVLHLLKT